MLETEPGGESSDEIYSDFSSLSFKRENGIKMVGGKGRLPEMLKNLPPFNKLTHFAENYDKPTILDESLGEVIKKQSQAISRPPNGPSSDEYSEFRNDARSASTPIPGHKLSEVNVSQTIADLDQQLKNDSCIYDLTSPVSSEIRNDARSSWTPILDQALPISNKPQIRSDLLHQEEHNSFGADSTFTMPKNIKPPVQKIPTPFGSNFSYLSEPESNVINLLQQKVQRELRTLPVYSGAIKDNNDNYKVTCKIEIGEFNYHSVGYDKSKEVAKRKSAEEMLKRLGDNNNLLRKVPAHDEIEYISHAKKFFVKHLLNNRNRTLHGAFDAVAEDDGRSG